MQDKVRGGGCFGCFSPKEKEEKQTAEEKVAKPSIGTPTGFVAPVEGSSAETSKVASEGRSIPLQFRDDISLKLKCTKEFDYTIFYSERCESKTMRLSRASVTSQSISMV